jgi:hypothetical protein
MKYLCLVYHDEAELNALAESDDCAIVDEIVEYHKYLRKSGHYIAAGIVQPAQMATTVRVRNGKVSIAAGPYGQANERLGEFYLIDARDLNDAIRLAAWMPPARLGCVEIRPLERDTSSKET